MRLFIGKETEKQLVNDVRKGDNAAIRKLYDTWAGYLFALCTRYVPDKDTAEDILQDCFLKIISSMDSFTWKGEGSLKAWISRIMVNEALQYLRKQKKLSFVEYSDTLPDTLDNEQEPQVSRIPPAEIQRMIQELPDGYRTVFNLFALEEKSHKEIAEMLGITESTSASQFHRARKILAQKIRDYEKRNA